MEDGIVSMCCHAEFDEHGFPNSNGTQVQRCKRCGKPCLTIIGQLARRDIKFEKDRLERLKRRAEWLHRRINNSKGELNFDMGEYSALRWAIDIIHDYYRLQESEGGK
jgi:hypothetical protein